MNPVILPINLDAVTEKATAAQPMVSDRKEETAMSDFNNGCSIHQEFFSHDRPMSAMAKANSVVAFANLLLAKHEANFKQRELEFSMRS